MQLSILPYLVHNATTKAVYFAIFRKKTSQCYFNL